MEREEFTWPQGRLRYLQGIRVNFRTKCKISGEGMKRNYLRFLVIFFFFFFFFCCGLIINTMQISFVSVFWQFFQGNQGVKRITDKKKKKKKEYEVDFILEKCSREFYNFLVIFYFVSMFTTQHYKIIVKTKKCKLLSRIKTFSFPTVLRGTKI